VIVSDLPLSGGHRKAMCSLEYSDEYRLLVTASFDHDVCVWSPYADKLIYKMKGMLCAAFLGASIVNCYENTFLHTFLVPRLYSALKIPFVRTDTIYYLIFVLACICMGGFAYIC
jgi:hypothetical protein